MKTWLVIFAALAIGCSQHHSPTQSGIETIDPPQSSLSKKSYIIPFETPQADQLLVSAIININTDKPEFHPKPKRLAIDTGAAHTAFFVPVAAVSDFHVIFPQSKLDERLAADGNIVHVCHFPTGRVTIGNLSVDMPVDASGYDMKVVPEMDGVVGLDFLSRFDVHIDFRAKTITLTER